MPKAKGGVVLDTPKPEVEPSEDSIEPATTLVDDKPEIEINPDFSSQYEIEVEHEKYLYYDDLQGEEEGEGGEEERKEKEYIDIEKFLLSIHADDSDILPEYGEEEEEEGEEVEKEEEEVTKPEEIITTPKISVTEKPEEERSREPVDPDQVLGEIPAEVLVDRDNMLEKLRELLAEQPDIWRKNKLLELHVSKVIKSRGETGPTDTKKTQEELDKIYKAALSSYKLQREEIMAQQNQLSAEIQYYENKIAFIKGEDEQAFADLVEREREVALGLVYAKTGNKITERSLEDMIHRQTVRRNTLSRIRYVYILLQHRFEALNSKLRSIETLGEGMTTMDYEALRITNITHKDKLDERDRELEKLRTRIEETVNAVAHYKEKETCLLEDIQQEEKVLETYANRNNKAREEVHNLHVTLRDLRNTYTAKKLEAGLLVAQSELQQMERTSKVLNDLKSDIEVVKAEIQLYSMPFTKYKQKLSMQSTSIRSD